MSYGLSEDLLGTVFDQTENDKPLSWSLRGILDRDLYQDLYPFLKKWPHTRTSTKSSTGKFYSIIDINQLSQCVCYSIVMHGFEPNASLLSLVKECMEFNQTLISDLEEIKKQRDEAKRELNNAQLTLREALDELKVTVKCKTAA
uniref:Uncharacterized protein n=1 Tax=Amphimedon queenslandica TaxID=400682 RepID=A0A1X7T4W7_AMPQE